MRCLSVNIDSFPVIGSVIPLTFLYVSVIPVQSIISDLKQQHTLCIFTTYSNNSPVIQSPDRNVLIKVPCMTIVLLDLILVNSNLMLIFALPLYTLSLTILGNILSILTLILRPGGCQESPLFFHPGIFKNVLR